MFNRKNGFLIVGSLLISTGFVLQEITPFFLSFGVVCIGLQGIINIENFRWNSTILAITALWILTLLSGLYSENATKWTEIVVRQLALLLIPLGFCTVDSSSVSFRGVKFINGSLLFFITLFGLATFIRYMFNYSVINEAILHSKSVPVWDGYSSLTTIEKDEQGMFLGNGVSHIYFSILQAFAVLFGMQLWWKLRKYESNSLFRKFILLTVVLNFLFLHVFLARTGLLALYCGAAGSALVYCIKNRKIILFMYGSLLIAAVFSLAWVILEPVQNKVDNALDDIAAVQSGEDINHRSLAMRVEAWKTGLDIIKDHPLIGVGAGDAEEKMLNQYVVNQTALSSKNRLSPHNQYIEYAIAQGMIGLAVLLSIFYLFYRDPVFRSPLGIAFLVMLMVAMFFESILQRQHGIAIFAFSVCWWQFNGRDSFQRTSSNTNHVLQQDEI